MDDVAVQKIAYTILYIVTFLLIRFLILFISIREPSVSLDEKSNQKNQGKTKLPNTIPSHPRRLRINLFQFS